MKLTTGRRVTLLLVAGVASLALVLYAKYESLAFFVAHRTLSTWACLLVFAVLVLALGRVLRASNLQLGSVALPLLLILGVDLVVSPLPYELAHVATGLPHPAGALSSDAATTPNFEASHPVASVAWSYPEQNVSAFTDEGAAEFARAGWSVIDITRPSAAVGAFGALNAAKDDFRVYCTFGPRLETCLLSV